MQVGDLITYNAGGMKNKVVGLIVEKAFPYCLDCDSEPKLLIQWLIVGKFMPRRDWSAESFNEHDKRINVIKGGDMVWHKQGSWFEVVNE